MTKAKRVRSKVDRKAALSQLEKQALDYVESILVKGPVVSLSLQTARFTESPKRGRELETGNMRLGFVPANVIRAALYAYVAEARKQDLADAVESASAALRELHALGL